MQMIIAVILLTIALALCIIYILMTKSNVRSLNKTLQSINSSDTNMLLTTASSDKDICSLIISINRLLESQKEIKALSQRESRDFKQAITNISHDLRTPLTSITGYVQLIKSDKTSQDKKDEYLLIVQERLVYLSQLLNSLFEYTKIIEGKSIFNIERVNVCNTLRDTISANYQGFIEKGFEVNLSITDEPLLCYCDNKALERVFGNLIQNALLHGIDYFEISVKDGSIIFKNKVKNISELDVEMLFDRFYTADLSRSSKSTGLGLAIAKELLNKMGAEITAYSQNDLLAFCIKLKQKI